MCTKLEFDMEQDVFESMVGLMETRLKEICDPCSSGIYTASMDEIECEEDLFYLIGNAMFNSLIVDALTAVIESEEIEEDIQ